MLSERRAERYVQAVMQLLPDLLALLCVEIRVEGEVLYRVLQVVLGVELLLCREVPVEHDASFLLLAEQPAPEGMFGGFAVPRGFSRRRAERCESVFGAHGVPTTDDHRGGGPGIAGAGGGARRRAGRCESVFGAHGVPTTDDHRVCGPGIAGLGSDLLFYPRESRLVHATQSRGLVLDAEQDEAPVFLLPSHPSLLR